MAKATLKKGSKTNPKTKKTTKNHYHKVGHAHEPRAHFIRRVAMYTFFACLTLLLSLLVFYRAKGYTFTKNGQVEKRGIVLINSAPVSAKIIVDGRDIGKKTDYKLEISEGRHNLRLEADGYRTWQTEFDIKAEQVEWLYYPYLVPSQISPQTVQDGLTPKIYSSLNSDNQLIAVHKVGAGRAQAFNLELLQLRDDNPNTNPKPIIVPSQLFARQTDGSLGELTFGKWSPNGDSIFGEYSYAGKKEIISIRINSPEESKNLTNSIGANIAQYRYDDRSRLVLLKDTELKIYNPNTLQPEQNIDSSVVSFNNFQDAKYVYAKAANPPASGLDVYIKDGDASSKKITFLAESSPSDVDFQYTINRRSSYLTIANSRTLELLIYKNPLESDATKPIEPLYLSTFKSMLSNQIKQSPGGSSQPGVYIALQLSPSSIFIYDFENESSLSYSLTDQQNVLNLQDISWIDSQHLQAKTAEGAIYYFDFDGNYLNRIATTNQPLSYFIKNKNKTVIINPSANNSEIMSQVNFKS